jgi:chromosome transmission fidelity protein 18
MASLSSPELPPTSDPALIEDWDRLDQNTTIPPSSSSYSDELEAISLTHKENVARKTEAGQVIQHRAWKLAEAFRSDPDSLPGANITIFI